MSRAMFVTCLCACGAPATVAQPARPLDPSACALDTYAPATVSAYVENDHSNKVMFPRYRGADVFIDARPGLTVEWLRHELVPRVDPRHECALGVPGAEVVVSSDGPGFRVTIRSLDAHAAEQILTLARVVDTRR